MFRKLFHDLLSSKPDRDRIGKRASLIGLMVNIFLAGLKLIVGVLSNSIAIIGDGVNNLTDSISSILAVISFKVSSIDADREHPYGHARIEYIISGIVAAIIFYIGINLGWQSIRKIMTPEQTSYTVITVIALLASIVAKVWQYYLYRFAAKTIDSELLKATALDSLADIMSTSAIIVSIILKNLFDLNLDGWIGILVAVLIVKAAYDIIRDTYNNLLGVGLSEQEKEEIYTFILNSEGVRDAHDLTLHEYGPTRRYITVDVEICGDMSVREGHRIATQVEAGLLRELNLRSSVHIDPVQTVRKEDSQLYQHIISLSTEIEPSVVVRDFHVYGSNKSGDVYFDIVLPHGTRIQSEDLKKTLKQLLTTEYPDYSFFIEIHHDI